MKKTKHLSAFSILLLATLACNAFSSTATAAPAPTVIAVVAPTSAPAQPQIPLTEADVPRVSLEDAHKAYNDGTAIIVDVRGADAYNAGHIPGAMNIQLGEFETDPANVDLPKDAWIITYCT